MLHQLEACPSQVNLSESQATLYSYVVSNLLNSLLPFLIVIFTDEPKMKDLLVSFPNHIAEQLPKITNWHVKNPGLFHAP